VGHRPSQDDESNLSLLSFSQNETTTYAKFSRMLDTGDSTHDQPIHVIFKGYFLILYLFGSVEAPKNTLEQSASGILSCE
jgi:hypothetical protein